MKGMTAADIDRRIEAVRRFNRLYTRQIGVLRRDYLDTPFSLTEARVLYELAQSEGTTATRLSQELDLDPGYLSRMLQHFHKQGLIEKARSSEDGRRSLLSLTEQGREAFAILDDRSRDRMAALLEEISPPEQERLVRAMQSIEQVLAERRADGERYVLRSHRPGDMGWVVHRHGVLYHEEYGWDEQFEALVAEIVARFVREHDPERERCWIAEMDGAPVGSVFLVKHSDTAAQLRLLLVEPEARGLGIGSRLVDECIGFARAAGYRKIMLWTNDVLVDARRVYERAGFRLVLEEPHHSFGHDLVGQTWEREL
jgi:DNA-binding MarR family transcriptional regulator/GNAT superfamily N-acetyltransferase